MGYRVAKSQTRLSNTHTHTHSTFKAPPCETLCLPYDSPSARPQSFPPSLPPPLSSLSWGQRKGPELRSVQDSPFSGRRPGGPDNERLEVRTSRLLLMSLA